jgi:hypothetical protein
LGSCSGLINSAAWLDKPYGDAPREDAPATAALTAALRAGVDPTDVWPRWCAWVLGEQGPAAEGEVVDLFRRWVEGVLPSQTEIMAVYIRLLHRYLDGMGVLGEQGPAAVGEVVDLFRRWVEGVLPSQTEIMAVYIRLLHRYLDGMDARQLARAQLAPLNVMTSPRPEFRISFWLWDTSRGDVVWRRRAAEAFTSIVRNAMEERHASR